MVVSFIKPSNVSSKKNSGGVTRAIGDTIIEEKYQWQTLLRRNWTYHIVNACKLIKEVNAALYNMRNVRALAFVSRHRRFEGGLHVEVPTEPATPPSYTVTESDTSLTGV